MIKIYSHPRSGTNYLAHLIGLNLYQGVDLSTKPGYVGHWNDRVKVGRNPYGKLFGGHGLPERYRLDRESVYIFRDGREVALSIWNSSHFVNPDWKKSGMTFSEFIRTPLDWVGSPGGKVDPTFTRTTIFEHWKDHIHSWELDNRAYFIPYHELCADPCMIISELAKSMNMKLDTFKNVDGFVGWFPSSINRVDRKSSCFEDEEDEEWYMDKVGGKDYLGVLGLE